MWQALCQLPITRSTTENRADLSRALIDEAKLRMQPIMPSGVTTHLTPLALG
jgi:hypothetical protein